MSWAEPGRATSALLEEPEQDIMEGEKSGRHRAAFLLARSIWLLAGKVVVRGPGEGGLCIMWKRWVLPFPKRTGNSS